MDMLLRHLTVDELAHLLASHENASPAPHLLDKAARAGAAQAARRNGLWQELDSSFDPGADIPVVKRSAFRNYRRCGDRTLHQGKMSARRHQLDLAALALWLDHPKAELDYLQDLLWAYCDEHTWVMAAHEGRSVDLGAAMLAADLAEILHVLGDRLEDEVADRVREEIEERILQAVWSPDHLDFWQTCRMNWNHVCNGEIVRAALYLERDPRRLAHLIHTPIQNMTYALDGFANDGGCLEGPGYWAYGFGHFLKTALAVWRRTGGELNLASHPFVEAISRYPLSIYIDPPLRACYSDGEHGYLPALPVLTINQFMTLPELYALCPRHEDNTLKLTGWHELALGCDVTVAEPLPKRDALLPDLGLVMARSKPGSGQVTLQVLAGHNGVPHNHLDVGTFVLHRGDDVWVVDPGAPLYRQKTFGPDRYEIVYCNCLGHSVPMIDGQGQGIGANFRAGLVVRGLDGDGTKTITLDLTQAYPNHLTQQLIRTFRLDPDSHRVELTDSFAFGRVPTSVEEAFVTFAETEVVDDGLAVRIGPAGEGVTIRAVATPGSFSTQSLEEACREDARHPEHILTRITFSPAELAESLKLTFVIE